MWLYEIIWMPKKSMLRLTADICRHSLCLAQCRRFFLFRFFFIGIAIVYFWDGNSYTEPSIVLSSLHSIQPELAQNGQRCEAFMRTQYDGIDGVREGERKMLPYGRFSSLWHDRHIISCGHYATHWNVIDNRSDGMRRRWERGQNKMRIRSIDSHGVGAWCVCAK